MKFHQGVVLSRHPEADMEAATKWYVDQLRADLGIDKAAATGLFVTDVTSSSGIVGNLQYVQGTVPADVVILEATTDQDIVRIHFLVEGDSSFYSPTVLVDTTYPGSPDLGDIEGILTQDGSDLRTFHGYADVDVTDVTTEGRFVTLVSPSSGATAEVLIRRAPEPPVIQSLQYGTVYPTDPFSGNPQTALKGGDIFTVTGTVENTATVVTLSSNIGSVGTGSFSTSTTGGVLGAPDTGGVGYRSFVIQYTVTGSRSGPHTAEAYATNSFGSDGPLVTTSDMVLLDQSVPNIGAITVTYPAGQLALKNSETANVNATITNFTDVRYSTTSNNFISIDQPTVYGVDKVATRIGGDYLYDGNNYIIAAYKTSNGTSSTKNSDVNISNVAPTVSITGASSRLISSPTGQTYQITMTFSQRLLSAPTIISSGDTTAGDRSAVTGSGSVWRFNLTIRDDDIRGVYNWTVNNVITLSNNVYNGVTITSGSTYEIGGFTQRNITIGALEQAQDIGVMISNPNKVQVRYAGTTDLLTYRGSNLSQFQKGWSTVDGDQLVFTAGVDPYPNYSNFVFQNAATNPSQWFFLTDANFAGANTTGTLQITISEVA